MRPQFLVLAIAASLTTCFVSTGFAQQRRPVTVYFRQASVAKTQWSPDSASSRANPTDGAPSNGAAASGSPTPGTLPPTAATPAMSSTEFSSGFTPSAEEAGRQSDSGSRPTLQQMQNPSGSYQLTHAGFSHDQYTSPNTYMGRQFNDWNNLSARSSPNLDAFESFNRTQPPTSPGGYVSPNNYTGPMNNQWSNLSSGYITPNYLGSWIYQQR